MALSCRRRQIRTQTPGNMNVCPLSVALWGRKTVATTNDPQMKCLLVWYNIKELTEELLES